MKLKRIISILFLLVVIIVMAKLIIEVSKPEILPIGSPMPEISFTDISGSHLLQNNQSKNTIIMLFHRKCEHCKYQMDVFSNNIEKLRDTKLYLFTAEKNYVKNENYRKWNRLNNLNNVEWGMVNTSEFKTKFGSLVTPYLLFFNKSNKLVNKIRGEVKFTKITELLQSLDDSGTSD